MTAARTANTDQILRGTTLSFRADPFAVGADAAIEVHQDGAVVVRGDRIVAVGDASRLMADHPGAAVTSYADHLIMAGFVDCHVHYPQTGVIASFGSQLIEWLEKYTFPAEIAFSDPDHAARVAELFLDEILRHGITTSSVYCTSHPQSVDAFFEASQRRGLRMAAGKVMMDRNAPAKLIDTATGSYDESKALIERWHGNGRATYVVSPRFAPTSTPQQLEAAGTLWREHPTTLMQTHIDENRDEIAWVKSLYPGDVDYFAVYERFGLVGPGANFGHAIHMKRREISALRASGSGVSHCPTSNLFIGSGLFDLAGLRAGKRPLPVGLATDVGGGSSFSMFTTMKAAYEIAQLRGYALNAVHAFYLATLGSAGVMRLEDRIGNLAAGYEADIIVIDLKSRPLIRHRMQHAADISEALFLQMILADDRAIRAVYSGGRLVHERADGLPSAHDRTPSGGTSKQARAARGSVKRNPA